ncbi:MAG: hypothetical protein MZU97_06920 [Bacillus subtilis]|nr:hypothetical protein [Bacillus subtilis]
MIEATDRCRAVATIMRDDREAAYKSLEPAMFAKDGIDSDDRCSTRATDIASYADRSRPPRDGERRRQSDRREGVQRRS